MLLSYLSAFLETKDYELVSCSSSLPFIGFPGDRGYGFRITYPFIKILWIQMFCVWELLCNSLKIINFWIIIHWIIVVITYLWPGGCHVGWIQFQNKCYFFSHTVATWFDAGVSTAGFIYIFVLLCLIVLRFIFGWN